MRNIQRLKKLLLVGAFSLVVSVLVPGGTSHAAPAADAYDMVRSIFKQVGLHDPAGGGVSTPSVKPAPDSSRNGQAVPKQPSQPPSQPISQPGKQQPSQSLSLADRIIKTGEKYLGTPYKYGAPSGQTRYFDCSLFVQQVFKENGIYLPRSSRQQAKVGTYVPRDQIRKGDLLFFTTSYSPNQIAHVGIYAGNNKILHTWGPGGVRYDDLNSMRWLREGYVTARRVIP